MQLAHKIEMKPTKEQGQKLNRACGHVTSIDSALESVSCLDKTRITQVYTL